jgi:hypothetical protein
MCSESHSFPFPDPGSGLGGFVPGTGHNRKKRGDLHKIDHVELEAPQDLREETRWFYREVSKLEELFADHIEAPQLCFRAAQVELRIRLVEHPRIEPIKCRMTLLVPSLAEALEVLEEKAFHYEKLTGFMYTDRRIVTNDPAGNRVELKQEWPFAPL